MSENNALDELSMNIADLVMARYNEARERHESLSNSLDAVAMFQNIASARIAKIESELAEIRNRLS